MPRDSVAQTLKVAVLLCLVCSLLVSAAAVGLRPLQKANEKQAQQEQILLVAGVDPGDSVAETFEQNVVARLIDLETGKDVTGEPIADGAGGAMTEYTVESFNQQKAARLPGLSMALGEADIAGIKRRENVSFVYFVKNPETGEFSQLVVPIRGYGLWSVLQGYLALDLATLQEGPAALNVTGITYYQHKETPGLGGEVDNPAWKGEWPGKHIYDSEWQVEFDVAKAPKGDYEVSALSGATITSNGVDNMIAFWFGELGFRTYLKRVAESGVPQAVTEASANTGE